ncbi:hypothetical protein KOR42_40650 [Thalassoglobus neptunius]|uniref:Uncharacterized protein n=1 Tax=Thalassoglobus neptunius TaxID=1938619 RepID=A0A5C5WD33_9PLAN|nr:hypothetical protein KOR42_40650 [Thalassoglobus neptunius]
MIQCRRHFHPLPIASNRPQISTPSDTNTLFRNKLLEGSLKLAPARRIRVVPGHVQLSGERERTEIVE